MQDLQPTDSSQRGKEKGGEERWERMKEVRKDEKGKNEG